MTATEATPIVCPSCGSTYVTDLADGTRFCAACRNEWDPKAPAPRYDRARRPWQRVDETDVSEGFSARVGGRQAGEPLADEQDLIDRVDGLGNYSTFMHVSHDDGGSGNWRTDLFTWNTPQPHDDDEARNAAFYHYEDVVGSKVAGVVIFGRSDGTQAVDIDDLVEPVPDMPEGPGDETATDAVAYLESLIGHGITLEGGQRATILSFEDDDQVIVQLAGGDTAVVDFNDIVGADARPGDLDIVVDEIDDATAQAFATGSLLFACMVIEAGIASIEGDGDEAHLVESPTDWFITDEDAVPLMEQASAAAVAMLIQTFALPRAALVEMVETVRNDALAATATEDTGHDANASDDE